MKRAGGRSVQGYNVQVAASPEQIIIAARVTQAHNDSDQLAPMVDQATATLTAAGIGQPIGTVLADGGYWNSPQITDIRGRGIDVLVPTKNAKRTKPRRLSPRQGDEAERIEQILDSDQGRALYRRRQQIVEPVFAHTEFLRRIDRFQRRGRFHESSLELDRAPSGISHAASITRGHHGRHPCGGLTTRLWA